MVCWNKSNKDKEVELSVSLSFLFDFRRTSREKGKK